MSDRNLDNGNDDPHHFHTRPGRLEHHHDAHHDPDAGTTAGSRANPQGFSFKNRAGHRSRGRTDDPHGAELPSTPIPGRRGDEGDEGAGDAVDEEEDRKRMVRGRTATMIRMEF